MTDPWTAATAAVTRAMGGGTRPYDAGQLMRTVTDFNIGLWRDPARLATAGAEGMAEWGRFWAGVWTAGDKPKDRRFADPAWQEDAWYRALRDGYLLAAEQIRRLVADAPAEGPDRAMIAFLLDGWLNAVAPTNFAMTNPQVVARTLESGGANLVAGFANLVEDVAEGKGIVRRRSDPGAFEKGVTIAATPGEVVWQNDLCQIIQYTPTTPDVAAEPLLYVPPLVNRFYMIDLQPRSSLVKWLVDEGRTVFVVSWVNPTEAHRDRGVEDYVLDGIVEGIGVVRERTGRAPDLFAFCLGGTLVAIALAWLAAEGRADEANSATLIGSMVDFADMRDWSAFVHEAHLTALEAHLERQGFIEATELQGLFAAMRANDLVWSSVVNHYLLDRPAPASDLLYWFEDGARIPAAFLKSYNRELLLGNRLREPAGFAVRGRAIDLAAITTPMLSIALKDDHVSAWEAVYDGARMLGADYLLGGSGHNAGVINPPSANKHGYWTNAATPETGAEWLAGADRHDGSWWPWWTGWLGAHGSGERVPARTIDDGIEPAPGAYAKAA